LTETFVRVLDYLECEHALVFCGEGGVDEISVSGRTQVSELVQGSVRSFFLNPEELGLPRSSPEHLLGGDAAQNGRMLREVLQGKLDGAPRDAVLLNAAAGIYVAGRADSLGSGLMQARESLGSGQALRKLEQLVELTNSQPA
jgi:anthranilate phosphoribosyltransferase